MLHSDIYGKQRIILLTTLYVCMCQLNPKNLKNILPNEEGSMNVQYD